MKICSSCGQTKDISEFHKDITRPLGVRSQCKSCVSSSGRRYRKASPPNYIYKRWWLRTWLKESPQGKLVLKAKSSKMKTSYSLTKIQEEIDKCDVVCANCHRIRTDSRNQERYTN